MNNLKEVFLSVWCKHLKFHIASNALPFLLMQKKKKDFKDRFIVEKEEGAPFNTGQM